jgi:hypothetical protein
VCRRQLWTAAGDARDEGVRRQHPGNTPGSGSTSTTGFALPNNHLEIVGFSPYE